MMEKLLRKAEEKCDEAEIFFAEEKALSAETDKEKIKTCSSAIKKGYGLRVVKQGKMGFSFFHETNAFDDSIKKALYSAKVSNKENFSFPEQSFPSKVSIFDQKIVELTEEDLIELSLDSVNTTKEYSFPLQGEIDASQFNISIINSHGVFMNEKETSFSVVSSAIEKGASFYDANVSKKFFDVSEVAKNAGELTHKLVGGKPIEYSGEIILSVDALANFLSAVILDNFNGESVRRKKVKWFDKLNEKVVNEKITITDDPLVPWGSGTRSFDDEGVACKKKTLVENGVLKNFLYDSQTANLSNAMPTGNGFRDDFSSQPGTGVTNLIVDSKEKENVFEGKSVYLLDLMGFHNVNQSTGEFSLNIENGFVVEDGEFTKPIVGGILVGNIFDILNNELVFHDKPKTRVWLTSPEIKFEGKIIK